MDRERGERERERETLRKLLQLINAATHPPYIRIYYIPTRIL